MADIRIRKRQKEHCRMQKTGLGSASRAEAGQTSRELRTEQRQESGTRRSAGGGQRSRRQLAPGVLPTTNKPVGVQKQGRADGWLLELAGAVEAGNNPLGSLGMLRRQVNLGQAPIGQGHVDFDKVKETGERAALAEARPGLLAPGRDAPTDPLVLGKRAPSFGDRSKNPADRHLGGSSRISRDKRRIRILAMAIALPDHIPALTGSRDVEDFHNQSGR